MEIKAAIVPEKGGKIVIDSLSLAEPAQEEVLVKIKACGICHTDEVARNGLFSFEFPAVLGHEGAGIVERVGSGVTAFQAGDRVSFSYGYCGACEMCRSGHPYACFHNRKLNFFGKQFDGTKRHRYHGQEVSSFFGQSAFATYAVVHVNNLIKLDEDISPELAAPLGCGIQTGAGTVLNCLKPEADSAIFIAGCGAVGLSAIMAAKISACSKIIACDVSEQRLELAKHFGATHAVQAVPGADVPRAVYELTDGVGAHYAADCTGSGESLRVSLNCVRPFGTCAAVGAAQNVTFQVEGELMGVAKKLVGVVEGYSIPQVFIPKLLSYYRAGVFPFDELIRYYDFEDIHTAIKDVQEGKTVKAVLLMNS